MLTLKRRVHAQIVFDFSEKYKKGECKSFLPPPLKIITSQDNGYHCYSNQEQVPDQFQTIQKLLIHYIGPLERSVL